MANPWDSFTGWMQSSTPQRTGSLPDDQLATYDAQAVNSKLARKQAVLQALQAQAIAPQDAQQFVRSNVGTFYSGPTAASQLARVAQMVLASKGLSNTAAEQAQNNSDAIDATRYILDHKPQAQTSYEYKNPSEVGPTNQVQGTAGMAPAAPAQQAPADMSVSSAPINPQDGNVTPEQSLGLGGSLGDLGTGTPSNVQPTPVTPAVKQAVVKAMSPAPSAVAAVPQHTTPNLYVPPKLDLRATAAKTMGNGNVSPDDITLVGGLFAAKPPVKAVAPTVSGGGGQFDGHGASGSWSADSQPPVNPVAAQAAAVLKTGMPYSTLPADAGQSPQAAAPDQPTAPVQQAANKQQYSAPSTSDAFNVTTTEPTAGEHAAWLAQLAHSSPMGQAMADRMMGSKGEYAIQDGYLINKTTGGYQKLEGTPAELGRHLDAIKQAYSGVTDTKSLDEANRRLVAMGVQPSYLTNDVQVARRSAGQTDTIQKENESQTSYENSMASYKKSAAILDGIISNPETIKQAKGDLLNNVAAHLPWATDTAEARSKIKEALSGMVMSAMQAMKQSGVGTGAFNSDKEGEQLRAALADTDFVHLGKEALQAKINSLRTQVDDAMARLEAARTRNAPGAPAATAAAPSPKTGNALLDFSRK